MKYFLGFIAALGLFLLVVRMVIVKWGWKWFNR